MINVEFQVSYPGLTKAEEERLAEKIRATIQHHIVTIACTVQKDDESGFINSTKLDVYGQVRIA